MREAWNKAAAAAEAGELPDYGHIWKAEPAGLGESCGMSKTGVKHDFKIFLVLATGRKPTIYWNGEDWKRFEEEITRAQFWTWILN